MQKIEHIHGDLPANLLPPPTPLAFADFFRFAILPNSRVLRWCKNNIYSLPAAQFIFWCLDIFVSFRGGMLLCDGRQYADILHSVW